MQMYPPVVAAIKDSLFPSLKQMDDVEIDTSGSDYCQDLEQHHQNNLCRLEYNASL